MVQEREQELERRLSNTDELLGVDEGKCPVRDDVQSEELHFRGGVQILALYPILCICICHL